MLLVSVTLSVHLCFADEKLIRTNEKMSEFLSFLLCPGAVILLGRTNMFRFNHPKEAARLREKRKVRLCLSGHSAPAGHVFSTEAEVRLFV